MKIMPFFKDIAKKNIEFFSRKLHKKNIFIFNYNNKRIQLFLPNIGDHIQQQIIIKKKFYEEPLLLRIKKYIKPNSFIIDIGSNIGNHAVFFGKILDAKKIYCFEPQKEMFDILLKNLELNNLSKNSKCYPIGIGDKKSKARLLIKNRKNLGGTSLLEDNAGKIKIMPLDNIKLKLKVDFIKIDVEGFERKVIFGATNILIKDKPILLIEIQKENLKIIKEHIHKMGYKLKEKIGYHNYLFIPNEKDNCYNNNK